MDRSNRVLGMFLGLAIGDALGMPVETFTPDKIKHTYGKVTEYHRPDRHKWFDGHEAGTTTDDTQLTVAVAEALIESNGFNMDTMVAHHVKALEEDAGWGRGTRTAVEALRDGEHWSRTGQGEKDKSHGPGSGNGVAMKIAPLAAFSSLQSKWNLEEVQMLAKMTHRSETAIAVGELHYFALRSLLGSDDQSLLDVKRDILEQAIQNCPDELLDRVILAVGNSPERVQDAYIRDYLSDPNGGRTRFTSLVSYPTALYSFFSNPMSVESMYTAIALGGDTDTNASMVGAMLGALHGPVIFPSHLVEGLKDKYKIIELSNRFCDMFESKDQEIAIQG